MLCGLVILFELLWFFGFIVLGFSFLFGVIVLMWMCVIFVGVKVEVCLVRFVVV